MAWISIQDQLPLHDQRVWVNWIDDRYPEGGGQGYAFWDAKRGDWIFEVENTDLKNQKDCLAYFERLVISHWQPLPEPPNAAGSERSVAVSLLEVLLTRIKKYQHHSGTLTLGYALKELIILGLMCHDRNLGWKRFTDQVPIGDAPVLVYSRHSGRAQVIAPSAFMRTIPESWVYWCEIPALPEAKEGISNG